MNELGAGKLSYWSFLTADATNRSTLEDEKVRNPREQRRHLQRPDYRKEERGNSRRSLILPVLL